MVKKVIGVKGAFLSVGLIMTVLLSGCGNVLAGQDAVEVEIKEPRKLL